MNFQILLGDLTISLKTKADLALTTSMDNKPYDLKDENNNFIITNFSQTYQVRNVLVDSSSLEGIHVEVDVPTHYLQTPIINYLSSVIHLSDGAKKICQKDTSTIVPVGRSDSEVFPKKLNCLVPGTRCINIT